MAAPALGATYAGLSSTESIPTSQRIYDQTKEIIEYAKGRLSMSRVLMKNFASGGKMPTKDMYVKYKSDTARQVQVTLAVASGSWGGGTENQLEFSDKEANYISVGSVLVAQTNFVYTTGGACTYVATTPVKDAGTSQERMLVLEKGVSDGTNTPFRVLRGYACAGGGTIGTPNEHLISTKFIVLPKLQAEGSNEGLVWGDTPIEEYNYCEITLEKWGQTTLSKNIEFYQDEPIAVRNGRRTLDQYFKKFELKMLFGNRYTDLLGGRRRWATGGLDEYIETDNSDLGYDASDNIINFTSTHGAISSQSLNEFGSDKFYWGNENEKWWIMDNTAYTKLCNAFDNKIRIVYNEGLSIKYGIRVNDLDISGGGIFHITTHDLFSIYGLSNFSYIVDYDYIKYMHLQNEDLQIIPNAEKYLNLFEEVNYLYMNSGLLRRNPHAQYKIFNF